MGQGRKPPPALGGAKDAAPGTAFMIEADKADALVSSPVGAQDHRKHRAPVGPAARAVLIHAAIVEISGDIAEAVGVHGLEHGGRKA